MPVFKWPQSFLGRFYAVALLLFLIALFWHTGKGLGKSDPESVLYSDFLGYYRSARIVLSPDRQHIYDRQVQLDYFNELKAAKQSNEYIYSQNPPFFFLLLTPFALMPLELAFKVWILLSVLSGLFSIHLLNKYFQDQNPRPSLLFAIAALVSAPGWICITVGQMSWFMLTLCTLFSIGFLFKKEALSGISLALIACKFQYLLFFGIILLVQKRWKAIGWALITMTILLLSSAIVLGPENLLSYPRLLAEAESTQDYSGVFPEHMISMRAVLSLFLDRKAALGSSSLLMLLSLLPLAWLWKDQAGIKTTESAVWALAASICTALVFSAHSHIYDDLLLLLAAALTLPFSFACGKISGLEGLLKRGAAISIWEISLLAFPFSSWLLFIYCNSNHVLKRTPFAALNLLLLICALAAYRKSRAKSLNSPRSEKAV